MRQERATGILIISKWLTKTWFLAVLKITVVPPVETPPKKNKILSTKTGFGHPL